MFLNFFYLLPILITNIRSKINGYALKINWQNSRTGYWKGVSHYNIGEYYEVLSAFNRSAELNPGDTRIERMKQSTLVKPGRPEGKTGVAANTLKVEEELFDRELQEEFEPIGV